MESSNDMTIRALRYENHKALQFFLCFYSRSLCFTFLVVNFMINTLFLLICHMLKFVPYISYKLNRKSTFIYVHWLQNKLRPTSISHKYPKYKTSIYQAQISAAHPKQSQWYHYLIPPQLLFNGKRNK